jgi:protease-4
MKMKSAGTRRYLELNLNNTRPYPLRFGRFKPGTELETLRLIKRAAEDRNLRGMVLNTSGFSADREYLWELRQVLETFKAGGKKIAAYFDNADFDLYWLLSAADRIVMDGSAILSLLGCAWGRFYAKKALGKLGVGFRELRYLVYKSANEMFSRASVSRADREQYGAWLDDVFGLAKEAIMKGRSLSDESFNSLLNEDFLFSPKAAREKGLVDAVGREEAVERIVKEFETNGGDSAAEAPGETGAKEKLEIVYVTAGNGSLMTRGRHVPRYVPPKRKGLGKAAEIAVFYARGTTDLDQGMAARSLSKTILETVEKPGVKALVLRIDSPGGNAVAADYIAQAVREAKKEKPVVVSMGQAAASGGYWAAMYASHIMAAPCTLTGSIGVIAGWFFDKGLGGKLGLDTGSLIRGDHAGLLTGFLLPQRDLSEGEEARYRQYILDLYGEFVRKVAESRNMTEEALEPLARGRVYSGLAALRLGLIDGIGGYLEAIETARKLAELPEKKKIIVREYPRPKFRETLLARLFDAALPAAKASVRNGTLRAVTGTPVGLLFPLEEWEDIRYRLSRNGEAMPLLSLEALYAGPFSKFNI